MPSSSRLWFSNNVIGEGHLLVHHQHSPCALNRLVHTSRYRPRAPGIVRSNDPQVIFRGEDISYFFEIILFLSTSNLLPTLSHVQPSVWDGVAEHLTYPSSWDLGWAEVGWMCGAWLERTNMQGTVAAWGWMAAGKKLWLRAWPLCEFSGCVWRNMCVSGFNGL